MLDSSDDIMSAALHYLGLDPNSKQRGRLSEGGRSAAAGPALGAQIPLLRIYQRARHRRDLLRGRLLRRHQAGAEARGGGQERHRDRLCDPEGRRAVVVRQSRHPARRAATSPRRTSSSTSCRQPEVAAKNSNFVSYANGNLASQKFIDKDVLEDRTIYPDEATMAKLYTMKAHDAPTTRLMNRLWTRIKTGKVSETRLYSWSVTPPSVGVLSNSRSRPAPSRCRAPPAD